MLIAQISDFHIVRKGTRAYGRVDTITHLDHAVRALNSLSTRPALVIGTGDIAQDGQAEQYATAREILDRLGIPFAPVMGNHDHRLALCRAFAGLGLSFEPSPFVQYALDFDAIRVVVLDTVTEGSDEPSFCETRAAWLTNTLAASKKPTIIALHHPPFHCGVSWLEPKNPQWAAPLARVLRDAPHVVRLIAGHVHRAMQSTWAGMPVSTAPSTAHQVLLDLRPHAAPQFSDEAAGFQLHHWTGDALVTYTASTERFTQSWATADSSIISPPLAKPPSVGSSRADADSEPEELAERIRRAEAIFIDWDGCLVQSGALLPGAATFLGLLADKTFVLSNNSTDLPEDMAAFLARAGVTFPTDRILLAGHHAVGYTAARHVGKKVQIIANERLTDYARSLFMRLDDEPADVVLLLRDTAFTFAKLERAAARIRLGAQLVVSNADRTHPADDGGIVPETGALLAALGACVDLSTVEMEIVGKPNGLLFDFALKRAGVEAHRALMIGDNPDTDGRGAAECGIPSILLSPGSGITLEALVAALEKQPDAAQPK